MNVCTDSPSSLSAQVVFTSTIPNSSGNHSLSQPWLPHQRGNSSNSPPSPCRHHEDPLWLWICIFICLKSHRAITSTLCHSSSGTQQSLQQWMDTFLLMVWWADTLKSLEERCQQVHIAWLQGIFQAFVLPFQGSHSKRMILWIVVVIFRNEDLVQWVLCRDQPRGEILSQKESCSSAKNTPECFMQRGFKVAMVVQGWIPAPRRTTWPEGFSSCSATCPGYFHSILMEVVTAGTWRWRSPAAESSCGQQPPGSEEGWGLLQEPFLWL